MNCKGCKEEVYCGEHDKKHMMTGQHDKNKSFYWCNECVDKKGMDAVIHWCEERSKL